MAVTVVGDPTANMTEREINISQADFNPGPASGSTIAAGENEEIGRAEIGTDGQFVSYELVRPGQELGQTGQSGRGKGFASLVDSNGNPVDGGAEIRLIGRPINQDSTDEIMGWMKHRNLNQEDTQSRLETPPATETNAKGEEIPELVRHGRVLAIEARHPSMDVEIDLTKSDITIPGTAFY